MCESFQWCPYSAFPVSFLMAVQFWYYFIGAILSLNTVLCLLNSHWSDQNDFVTCKDAVYLASVTSEGDSLMKSHTHTHTAGHYLHTLTGARTSNTKHRHTMKIPSPAWYTCSVCVSSLETHSRQNNQEANGFRQLNSPTSPVVFLALLSRRKHSFSNSLPRVWNLLWKALRAGPILGFKSQSFPPRLHP